MAAASMKRAGKVSDIAARAMHTVPSSSDWRMTSRTLRGNSGSSSRNSTPLWARGTSPGRGTAAPPIRPRIRDSVVRRAEGPDTHQSRARIEHASDAVDLGGFERFLETERGQNSRHAFGEHGLARTGRADHQDIVA